MTPTELLSLLPPAGLPLPGGGDTPARHRHLAAIARDNLSVGRVLEAHTDAIAIAAEGGHAVRSDALYGVWASDGAQSRLNATLREDGRWSLSGLKQYCSGSSFCTAALVTAWHEDGVLLFDVSLDLPGVRVEAPTWANSAFADTATGPVSFDAVTVTADSLLKGANWYLNRPGFWHGAIGPAACWSGGAACLIAAATALNRRDAHSRAQVGALQSLLWGFEAILTQAGSEIDNDPADSQGLAHSRALKVRHLVERWCTETLDRFGRATGPQLLAFDAHIAKQYAALALYIRQCHAERDLEAIHDVISRSHRERATCS
jgi:alkylation response protein AidB-like acyl-CoA dehydrogenase